MKYPVLKSILAGVAIGAALFMFPFTIMVVGTLVTLGFLFRVIRGPQWHRYHHMHMAWAGVSPEAFANMSPDEKRDFRRKMYMQRCGRYTRYEEVKKEETI